MLNAISIILSKTTGASAIGETESSPVTIIKEIGKYIVKNGKYGPYVQYDKTIAKIPKSIVAGDITKEICKELIDKAKSMSKEGKKKKQYYASSKKKSDENEESD